MGDLSNLLEDESGEVTTMFTDDVITLNGGQSIIGRATVVSTALSVRFLDLLLCLVLTKKFLFLAQTF